MRTRPMLTEYEERSREVPDNERLVATEAEIRECQDGEEYIHSPDAIGSYLYVASLLQVHEHYRRYGVILPLQVIPSVLCHHHFAHGKGTESKAQGLQCA